MANVKFSDLASMVAKEFNNMVAEEGFESFKEMKRCYDWDWSDIKTEVNYMINKKFEDLRFAMLDDNSIARIDGVIRVGVCFDNEFSWLCPWNEFKKMFMKEVK